MAEDRERLQSPPPDDGGHFGSFTRPADDMMIETSGQADHGPHGGPPLHTDPARNEPTATYEGTRGGLIGLLIVAVIVIIALLGLLPAQGLFDTEGRRGGDQQTER